MKYIFSFSIIILLTLFACSSKNMSQREENVFKQSYQQLLIPTDSIGTLGEMVDYLTAIYCVGGEKNWPYLLFDMKTKSMVSEANRNTLEIGIEPPPCFKGRFNDKMVLEIVKDGYNTEIERIYTEVDSIPSFVRKQMLSFGSDNNYAVGAYNNGIWLSSSRKDMMVNLNPYIYQIIIGYLASVREYSEMAYLKEIDELSEKEYEEIYREFNFKLSFKYTEKPPELTTSY